MDNYDIWRDYGPANWDIPHRFVASYLYDIPFLKDSSQPILKYVVAGWQVSGVTTIQSGSPVNVTLSTDRANIGINGLQRPDLVGAVPELNCQPNSAGLTDAARRQLINCFERPRSRCRRSSRSATRSRNVLRGPKFSTTDLSFMKNIPVGGEVRFQVRVEVFNVFNKVNYGNPNASFGSAAFGTITSAGSMRQIQFGGKLLF